MSYASGFCGTYLPLTKSNLPIEECSVGLDRAECPSIVEPGEFRIPPLRSPPPFAARSFDRSLFRAGHRCRVHHSHVAQLFMRSGNDSSLTWQASFDGSKLQSQQYWTKTASSHHDRAHKDQYIGLRRTLVITGKTLERHFQDVCPGNYQFRTCLSERGSPARRYS